MKTNTPLPTGWIQMPLGNCGTWHGGGTPSKFNDSYWTNGTIPWISPKDMKTFRITDSEDHLAQLAIEETNVKPFPSGTVLVVIRSGILSRTLPVAVSQVLGTMNQDLKGLLPSVGIDSEFVGYFLQAYEQDILRKCSKHGTTVASIDTASLHSYPLSIAPLNEQRRIVAKIEKLFSDLDAGVAALKRAKANLKQYRAAVLKAAVEGKLTEEWRAMHPTKEPASALLARILKERRQKWEADQLAKFAAAKKEPPKNWRDKYVEPSPPNVVGMPELPADWCWASVEQLAAEERYALAIGPFGSNLKVPDYRETGVPLIFVRNIRSGVFGGENCKYVTTAKASELNAHSVDAGDILITKMGEPPGDACQYPHGNPKAIITADCIKMRLHKLLPNAQLIVFAINSQTVRNQIVHITKGVAQQKVSLDRFSTIAIPLSPLDEQQQIVGEVEEKLSQIDAAETQIEHGLLRAARLRQSILKQAFEGKLVPQDPNDEPASVLLERLQSIRSGHESSDKAAPLTRIRGQREKKKQAALQGEEGER